MKNEVMVFSFKGFEIRGVLVEDNPYFVGKDVAGVLGYQRADNAIRSHVEEEDKLMHQISALGQTRKMNIINESGLYSLILKSKLPEAKEFKRWVTSEVLPQIRKTGGYIPIEENESDSDIMAKALLIAQKTLEKKESIIAQQKEKLNEQAPKVEFHENVLSTDGTHKTRTIAADYGLSPQTLNKKLHALKIQYKEGNRWYLYSEHQGKGYTVTQTFIDRGGKFTTTSLRWTNKGRLFIYEELKKHNIYPNKENISKYDGVASMTIK